MRKDNTVFFHPFAEVPPEEDFQLQEEILLSIDSDQPFADSVRKKVVPVHDISNFYIMAEASFNTRFLEFCSANDINIHFFNRYGFYHGSYVCKKKLISGYLLVRQVLHYKNKKKRMELAKKIVLGASDNLLRNLKYYSKRGREIEEQIMQIENLIGEIDLAPDIPELMSVEGRVRKIYYTAYNEILADAFEFSKREYNPPTNPVNALISYCNSLVYTTALSEIYFTQLDPAVSFLHEPGERRFSLALDVAEIFKPILAERLIFKAVNSGRVKIDDFEKDLGYCYLKEKGRKEIARLYDERLQTTIKHRTLNRKISYRRLVRLECYKLIKHLTGEKEYVPFRIWW